MTTATDIVDGLTGSEVRQFALAVLQAVERAAWHRDWRRFIREVQAAAELAERLAVEPGTYDPPPAKAPQIVRIPVREVLTEEQRQAIRCAYIPRARGGRRKGEGPTLQELADQFGVSYGAAWRAARKAA